MNTVRMIRVWIWDARDFNIEHSFDVDVSPDINVSMAIAQAERIATVLAEKHPDRKVHVDLQLGWRHDAVIDARQITRDEIQAVLNTCTV